MQDDTIITEEAPDVHITEEATDTSSIDAEAVKAFLQEEQAAKDAAKRATLEKIDPKWHTVDADEGFNASFVADKSFQEDMQEVQTKEYFAVLEDHQIPISDDDQALFIKAMLNDTPVHLSQTLMGGLLTVECRALSVYENDLMLDAALKMSGSKPGAISPTLIGCAQQIRVAMQVTRVNNADVDYIELQPDRENREAQIKSLIKKTDERMRKFDTGKYGMLIRALNVFEHKLAKLNSLAYTGNFWSPGVID